LGERRLGAIKLLKKRQCPYGCAKRGSWIQGPATVINVDDQHDDNHNQEPAYIAEQLGDYKQDDSASQRHQQGRDAVVAFVNCAYTKQRAEEETSHKCPYDADEYIGNETLPAIGFHDEAGYPAYQSADNDPYNKVDHFILLG
jgi:hypothetical protein